MELVLAQPFSKNGSRITPSKPSPSSVFNSSDPFNIPDPFNISFNISRHRLTAGAEAAVSAGRVCPS